MRARVEILQGESGCQLVIRPAIRLASLCLMGLSALALASFALTAAGVVIFGNDRALDKLILAFMSAGSISLAFYFALSPVWQIFGKEVVDIGPSVLSITEMIGRRRVRSRTYDPRRVRNMRLGKAKYVAKGHPFAHKVVLFDYDGSTVNFAWRLSDQEMWSLLDGPLHEFVGTVRP